MKTNQKTLIFAFIALIITISVYVGVSLNQEDEDQARIQLSVWGPLEESGSGWADIIQRYRATSPHAEVSYRLIQYDEYERELLNAFALGEPPDIFYVQNAWLPKYQKFVQRMPKGESWMTFSEYRDVFVDVAAEDFTRGQEDIFAIPLFIETLALYYNQEVFAQEGVQKPPATWEDFRELARRLTKADANGRILRSGAAIGTAENINRASDILAALMLQRFGDRPIIEEGNKKVNIRQGPGIEALDFYTSFTRPLGGNYSWNTDQWYSIDAFVDGRAVMMLNYPHHLETVRNHAPTPDFLFGIARFPQPAERIESGTPIDYASYWGLVVTKSIDAKRIEEAWRFVAFMGEPRQQQDSIIRYTPKPISLPARRDLLNQLVSDSEVGVFARQALTARSWYQPDATAIEKIFEQMIKAVVSGESVNKALADAAADISNLFE